MSSVILSLRSWASIWIPAEDEFAATTSSDGLEDYLHAGVRKRAAISYIGPAAAELLDLMADDMIIIDGTDAALLAGQVDPNTISRWHKAGVDVRTLPNLHAKMIHLEGGETYVRWSGRPPPGGGQNSSRSGPLSEQRCPRRPRRPSQRCRWREQLLVRIAGTIGACPHARREFERYEHAA